MAVAARVEGLPSTETDDTHWLLKEKRTLKCLDSIRRKVGFQIKDRKQGYSQPLSTGNGSNDINYCTCPGSLLYNTVPPR